MTTSSTTLGLVLRATPHRESDVVLSLLTEAHGRISALARGARASRRRFGGALGFAVLARCELRPPRGELWTLERADVEREWPALAADLAAFAHAGYALELVSAVAPAEHADAGLFALVVEAFERLATSGATSAGLRAFELELFERAGSAPLLDACAGCGTDDLDGAMFAPARGGVVCRACAATSRGSVRAIAPATLAYLADVTRRHDHAALDAATPVAVRSEAREALAAFVVQTIGRELRASEFLTKLNAGLRGAP